MGIQTFERIRREDKLCIDKTEYIYRMAHTSGTYFFLGRPRRFGKYWFSSGTPTYLINMLNKYDVLPADIAPIEALASAFDAPTEKMKTITAAGLLGHRALLQCDQL